MLARAALTLLTVGGIASCGKAPTAMAVCNQLESAGVASNCRSDTPGGLGAAAAEDAEFDLPSVPGKGGMVLRFDTDDAYDRTVNSFSRAAMLAGPHRYGSRNARIFVQMNDGASAEIGAKAKATVDRLSGGGSGPLPSGAPAIAASPPQPPSPSPPPLPAPAASTPVSLSAMDVCQQLERAGVAAGCEGGDGGASQVQYRVPAVLDRGKPAQAMVLLLPNDKAYGVMIGGATASPVLSKAPLFTSEKARVIVFLMSDVKFPADVQAKTKAIVDAL